MANEIHRICDAGLNPYACRFNVAGQVVLWHGHPGRVFYKSNGSSFENRGTSGHSADNYDVALPQRGSTISSQAGTGSRISSALTLIVVLYVAMFLGTSAVAQDADHYQISWYAFDGLGQSSGGSYVLIGIVVQPDVAYSAGDQYELTGGFWPGGTLCLVKFGDFARFAQYWRETGDSLPADLDFDGDVDEADLSRFADWWLGYCPGNWPLR